MTTLLIDGDIEAFKAAAFYQEQFMWNEPGEVLPTILVNEPAMWSMIHSNVAEYKEIMGADEVVVCISSSLNFRKEVDPSYKAHRKDLTRPLMLDSCKLHMMDKYPHAMVPGLEADDVMGIIGSLDPKKYVIVSIDKDMLTIPNVRVYNPDKRVMNLSDEKSAFYSHMMQTLMGDATDGYKGIPGIGPKKAEKILAKLTQQPEWVKEWPEDYEEKLWAVVVEAYTAANLTEQDALRNARLAKILTKEWFSHPGEKMLEGKPLLWTPRCSSASVTASV